MNEENAIYSNTYIYISHISIKTYNEILFIHIREGNPAICINLEDTMLSKISQTQIGKCCVISLTYGIWKSWTHKTREQNGGFQRLGRGQNGEMLVKGYTLPVIRWMSSGDLMYIMVTIVNTILYAWNSLRKANYVR